LPCTSLSVPPAAAVKVVVVMDMSYAAPAARGINRRCHCVGGTDTTAQLSNYDVTSQNYATGMQRMSANSHAAQQHFEDGRAIKLRDTRGVQFEPQTSYVDHYPAKVWLHGTNMLNDTKSIISHATQPDRNLA